MAESRQEGKEADERGQLITHQVGLHVPHSLDTEVQEEGAVPAESAGGRLAAEEALRAEGLRGGGGQHLPGPRARVRQDPAQDGRVGRDGVREGQVRHGAARPSPRVGQGRREGQDLLGPGLLREHRRAERGGDKALRRRAGGGQQVRVARPFRGRRHTVGAIAALAATVDSGTLCPLRSLQDKTSGYAGGSLFD